MRPMICLLAFGAVNLASVSFAQVPLQQQQASQLREAVDAAYALGLQTGQAVTAMSKDQDDKLKWVLDNWVPKHPAPPSEKQP